MAQFVGKSNTFHSDANCGGYPHSFAQEMQNVAPEVSKMSRRIPYFRAANLCACGEHGFIGLPRGGVSLVSPQDLPAVAGRLWGQRGGYVRRTEYVDGEKQNNLMHREILEVEDDLFVDHINWDRSDNRRENIRICSRSNNMMNRNVWGGNKFKGVDYHKTDRAYRARITSNGKMRLVGSFASAIDAAKAYDSAAIDAHGEFAVTNAFLGLLTPSPALSKMIEERQR